MKEEKKESLFSSSCRPPPAKLAVEAPQKERHVHQHTGNPRNCCVNASTHTDLALYIDTCARGKRKCIF